MTDDPKTLIERGLIPWSADEYFAVLDERARLAATPHDDWDRRPKGFVYEGVKYRFNPDVHENQLMDFMVNRYRGQDHTTTVSHMNRYFTINEFLSTNIERLIGDGVIRPAACDDGSIGLPEALIEVLASVTYDATMRNLGGHEVPTFSYEAVVAAAKARLAEEGKTDGDVVTD